MIIQRYVFREIGLSFLAVTLVLGLMFLSGTFVRLLAQTLEGRYPADLLFTLFSLRGIGSMILMLPFALFIAVMLALGRLNRDSEMAVLGACGYGPAQLFRPVTLAGVLIALLVGGLSLYWVPWSEDRSAALLEEAAARTGVAGLVAGQFNALGSDTVVYVERIDPASKQMYGIFAVVQGDPLSYQLTAAQGQEYLDPTSGDRFILLQDGYRYEGQHGRPDFRIIHFEKHGVRVQERAVSPAERSRRAATSSALLHSDNRADQAELQWRLAMPLSTLLLALLAVPLSKGSPRQGRLFGLFLGLLVYMGYNNLLNITRSALIRGDLPLWLGLWWVHLLVAGLIVVLLWRQLRLAGPKGADGALS
ncbi:MAG: LPS export ABC transporter permease LptF [Gammaproteobacteria bacterium]